MVLRSCLLPLGAKPLGVETTKETQVTTTSPNNHASTTTQAKWQYMLKKNQPVKLKEGSTMWMVYQSIGNGNHSQSKVLVDTALRLGRVRSALFNLRFVGMLDLVQVDGRTRYYLPDQVKPSNAEIGKAENATPAQTLVKNSICITNSQIVGKLQKGGRPKKQAANPVMWRPKTQEARNKFIEMGGSKWLDRIMGGLTT